MRRHRDQIAAGISRGFQDSRSRVPQGEVSFHHDPLRTQAAGHLVKISAVVGHLLGVRQLETMVISRHPAVGNVEQKQRGAVHLRERGNMRQHRLVSQTVVERDENFLIHRQAPHLKLNTSHLKRLNRS